MSISLEYALEHKNDPAVLCCRAEEGTVLNEHNLEDPAIFDDLVDSNLLDLTGALKIGQVLGATLKETCDSLTALTADKVEGAKEGTDEPAAEASKTEKAAAPVIGGSVGGILGMAAFHHKTRHWYFRIGLPVMFLLQAAGAVYLLAR